MKEIHRSFRLRRAESLLAIAGALALAVACGPAAQPGAPAAEPAAAGKPEDGGVLLKWLGGDVPHFDSQQSSTYLTVEPAAPSYNTLIRFDPMDLHGRDLRIQGDLAERWEVSPDGKTYTFQFHKGIKFHAGGTFDAHDAKWNLERMKNPPQGVQSPRRAAFELIDRMDIVDDNTLRVVLKQPSPSFIPRLAVGWSTIYDKEWVEKGHSPEKEVNGTGPFLLKEFIRGVSVEHVKNPSYWKAGLPYLDGVKHYIIRDAGTSVAAFRTGQIMKYGATAAEAETLQREFGDRISVTDTATWGGPFINMSKLRKPFDDTRVRQALSLAIDRQDALKILGSGYVAGYMAAKGGWSLPPEELAKLPGYGRDIEANRAQAKKLLTEAGYPSGFEAKLGVRQVAGAEDPAIFAKDQLARIGVKVTLDVQETATAYTNLEKGTFDAFIWGTSGGTLDDPDAVYSEYFLCNAPRNYSQWCNPEVERLFALQTVELNPDKRKDLVWQMEKAAISQAHIIVVSGSQGKWATWGYLRDYVPVGHAAYNAHLEQVWLSSQR